MRAFLAVVALMALLPGVAAQELGMEFTLTGVTVDKEALVPNEDLGKVTVSWTVACKGPASQPHGLLIQSSLIQYDQPTAAEGITVTGGLSQSVQPPDCVTETEANGTSSFSVSASQAAVGEAPLPLRFQATLLAPEAMTTADVRSEPIEGTVTVAYFPDLSTWMETTIQDGSPGDVMTYMLEVTNLGNAPSTLLLASGSALTNGWLELPPSVVVPALGTVEVPVRYHAEAAGEETITLQVTPRSTRTDASGLTVEVNMLARVRWGFAAAPPVPAGIAALAVLAVAAAVARRRA